ncbi:hypothetical protein D3C71_1191670 [compost metagenome]
MFAEAVHQSPRQGGRRCHADLLAEHRACGHFKAVPAAGNAQAGALGDAACEQGFVFEAGMHGGQIGIQIEHPAHARDDGGNGARIGGAQLQAQFRALGIGGDADQAGAAIGDDHPLVAVFGDAFDARQRPLAQERQHRAEIQRRPVRQA